MYKKIFGGSLSVDFISAQSVTTNFFVLCHSTRKKAIFIAYTCYRPHTTNYHVIQCMSNRVFNKFLYVYVYSMLTFIYYRNILKKSNDKYIVKMMLCARLEACVCVSAFDARASPNIFILSNNNLYLSSVSF